MPRRIDITVTEQMTAPIDFQLLTDADDDGDPEEGINLSSVDHIEMWRRDNSGGTAMDTSDGGDISIVSAAAGSVRWSPGTADLQASLAPYQYQFKIFPTSSSWYYVPEDSWCTIHVRPRVG